MRIFTYVALKKRKRGDLNIQNIKERMERRNEKQDSKPRRECGRKGREIVLGMKKTIEKWIDAMYRMKAI